MYSQCVRLLQAVEVRAGQIGVTTVEVTEVGGTVENILHLACIYPVQLTVDYFSYLRKRANIYKVQKKV